MKRNLFILFAALCFVGPAIADVTVEEVTDAEYLINSGYSQSTAEDIFILKNRHAGKPIEPLYEKSGSPFIKGWRKFYSYLDPSQDEVDRIHHDIKLSPSYTDL